MEIIPVLARPYNEPWTNAENGRGYTATATTPTEGYPDRELLLREALRAPRIPATDADGHPRPSGDGTARNGQPRRSPSRRVAVTV